MKTTLGLLIHGVCNWNSEAYGLCMAAKMLIYLLTPWSTVLLKQLIGSQLVKKFPEFYGTQRFTTAFASAHHLSLSSARSIRSMPLHLPSWRSILILSSHLRLRLPNGLFPSGFPTKIMYTPLPHTCYMSRPSHSRVDRPNIWWGLQTIKLLMMQFSPLPCYLVRLRQNTLSLRSFSYYNGLLIK